MGIIIEHPCSRREHKDVYEARTSVSSMAEKEKNKYWLLLPLLQAQGKYLPSSLCNNMGPNKYIMGYRSEHRTTAVKSPRVNGLTPLSVCGRRRGRAQHGETRLAWWTWTWAGPSSSSGTQVGSALTPPPFPLTSPPNKAIGHASGLLTSHWSELLSLLDLNQSWVKGAEFLRWFRPDITAEGHGNPFQYSCLENPRDKGAWWSAVYGVAQNRTRLKRLSSCSRNPLQGDPTSPS